MDLQLLSKGLDLAKKRKKWILLFALFGASSYGAYKVYHLPSVTRKRRRLFSLLRAFFSVLELVSDSAETIGFVSKDLKEFLNSDSDEIPNSLRQISKIVRSNEFSDSLTRVSQGLTVGVLRGYCWETRNDDESGGDVSLVDKIMDRMLSNAGTGFVSVVAGSFARNLVLGLYSSGESKDSSNGRGGMTDVLVDDVDTSSLSKWVNVVSSDQCKEMIANCIQVFVSTAVTVYLEKTLDINFYDDMFSGLTNPNHESKMRDLLVSVCNGAVETLIKTSHQVLTLKKMDSNPTQLGECSTLNGCELGDGAKVVTHPTGGQVSDQVQGGSWGSMVLSTLSIPSNRKFVLDVTGRVTFETVRSLVEFSLWKLSDGLRNSTNAVHDHVKDKGRQVVRYFGLKSYVFVTIYFVLYLHIICGTRALLPA